MNYFTFNKKKYPFVKVIYTKTFIIYIKRIYKYINYKTLIESIKEKGLKLLVDKDIILINTLFTGRSTIFIYCKRKKKLINRNYFKKILELIRFKIIGPINLFIYS